MRRRSGFNTLPRHRQRSEDSDVRSSLTFTGSSQDEDEQSNGDDEISSDSPDHRVVATLTQREPDPRASRHSSRAEAKKPVNYSRKIHPQDYGLPGYRHRAVMPSPASPRATQKPSQNRRKRKAKISTPTVPDSDEDDDNAVESVAARLSDNDDDEQDMSRNTPARQPLGRLDSNSRPTKRRRQSKETSRSPPVTISSTLSTSDMDTDTAGGGLVDTLTQAEESGLLQDEIVSAKKATSGSPAASAVEPCVLPIAESRQSGIASIPPTKSSEAPKQDDDEASTSSTDEQPSDWETTVNTDDAEPDPQPVEELRGGRLHSQTVDEVRDKGGVDQMVEEETGSDGNTNMKDEQRRDSLLTNCQSDAEAESETMSAHIDAEAGASTVSARHDPEADFLVESECQSTPEQHDVGTNESRHFEDAMAVSEQAHSGEANHTQNGSDADKHSSDIDETPDDSNAAAAQATSFVRGTPDPLDSLPKPSSFGLPAGSLLSTAEPE